MQFIGDNNNKNVYIFSQIKTFLIFLNKNCIKFIDKKGTDW